MRCVVTPLFIYDNTAAELLVFSQMSHCWTSSSQAKWSCHCAQIISSFCVFSAFSSEVPHTFLSGYRWLLISPGWSVSLQEYTTHYCNRIICICYSVNIQTWAFLKKNQNTGLKWSIKECKGFVLLYALIIIISDHISSCVLLCVCSCVQRQLPVHAGRHSLTASEAGRGADDLPEQRPVLRCDTQRAQCQQTPSPPHQQSPG